jgi:hypothetical protein
MPHYMIEVCTIADTEDGEYMYKSYCLHEHDTDKVMKNMIYKQVKKENGEIVEESKGILNLEYFMKTYIQDGSLQPNCKIIQVKLVKYNKELLTAEPKIIKLSSK